MTNSLPEVSARVLSGMDIRKTKFVSADLEQSRRESLGEHVRMVLWSKYTLTLDIISLAILANS